MIDYDPVTGVMLLDGVLVTNVSDHGYLRISIDGVFNYVHRVAYRIATGESPMVVDHINGNKLDNRIANLRACTHLGNNQNAGTPTTNTSGYKNVSWSKVAGKWMVQVRQNYKRYHGGLFVCKEEANLVAIRLRNTLHGEYANHGSSPR